MGDAYRPYEGGLALGSILGRLKCKKWYGTWDNVGACRAVGMQGPN